MDIDLPALRQEIEAEIDRYLAEYQPSPVGLGEPWSREKVAAELIDMRECLVDPYWLDVDLSDPLSGLSPEIYACIAVAQDGDHHLMAYQPHRNAFLLLWRKAGAWSSLGVEGDAVGTFLAR